MNRDWSIRPIVPTDGAKIQALSATVFGTEMSDAVWRWQYLDNPCSRPIAFVAETGNGRIVGHYSLIPVPFWRSGSVETAAYSVLSMVHPDFQRQGMLKELAAAGEHQLDEDAISTGVTYLNDNSLTVYTQRLGWTRLEGPLPVYWSVIDAPLVASGAGLPQPLKAIAIAGAWLGKLPTAAVFRCVTTDLGVEIREMERFDRSVDALWDSVADKFQYAIVRNSMYLNWRYADNPTDYRIFLAGPDGECNGFVVIRAEEKFGVRFGYIADLVFDPEDPDVGLALLRHARRELHAMGCGMISALALQPAEQVRAFRSAGFRRLPKPLLPHGIHFCVKDRTDRQEDALLSRPEDWFVGWGDHDVV